MTKVIILFVVLFYAQPLISDPASGSQSIVTGGAVFMAAPPVPAKNTGGAVYSFAPKPTKKSPECSGETCRMEFDLGIVTSENMSPEETSKMAETFLKGNPKSGTWSQNGKVFTFKRTGQAPRNH